MAGLRAVWPSEALPSNAPPATRLVASPGPCGFEVKVERVCSLACRTGSNSQIRCSAFSVTQLAPPMMYMSLPTVSVCRKEEKC